MPRRLCFLVIAALLAGCSAGGFDAAKLVEPKKISPPYTPNSPSNTLRLLEWCYQHKDEQTYRELFTDDFVFAFSAIDPAGEAYHDRPFVREDELMSVTNLFHGGGPDQPPALDVYLQLDNNFAEFSDPRPGMANFSVHKKIGTAVLLQIACTDGSSYEIRGRASFFLVRGDSALIPQELVDRGFRPDSTRWWIQRWEDETDRGSPGPLWNGAPQPGRTLPTRSKTWGAIKAQYR
jgi:hypothetical protein